MSRRNRSSNNPSSIQEEVELKLNLSNNATASGSGNGRRVVGPSRGAATNRPVLGRQSNLSSSSSSSESESESPPRSCLSSEESLKYSSSPESEITSMVLVGCPRCLMYVMLSQADPRCPKCKSTVLLDFLRNSNTTNNNNSNNSNHHHQQHS